MLNAERLHTIARAVSSDFKATRTLELLKSLRGALQQQVAAPAEAPHQEAVANSWAELRAGLRKSATNSFSPAWTQAIEEIGVLAVSGQRLDERIAEVFARNQITPSVAASEIDQLFDEVSRVRSHVDAVVNSLAGLGVRDEGLSETEAEVGVLIPRTAVRNNLKEFGRELQRIERTLGVFPELVTGTNEGFSVRTISSSDLTVFLEAAPQVAACIAVAVERTVALYKNLLEIRKLRSDMEDQGVPAEHLQGVRVYSDQFMSQGIKEIAASLLDRYIGAKKKDGRRNELEKYLESSLNEIANRIDRGYHFEVRAVAPPAEVADEEASPNDAALHEIAQSQAGMAFIKAKGDSILQLPESADEEGPSSDPQEDVG